MQHPAPRYAQAQASDGAFELPAERRTSLDPRAATWTNPEVRANILALASNSALSRLFAQDVVQKHFPATAVA